MNSIFKNLFFTHGLRSAPAYTFGHKGGAADRDCGRIATRRTRGNKLCWVAIAAGMLSLCSSGWAQNPCDLNNDGAVNATDVQLAINMTLGLSTCQANIDGTGVCNAVVVQRVINAADGGSCMVGNQHSVSLSWTASASQNVAGYNIYRGASSGGPYTKINSTLITVDNYTDNSVQSGQTYYYVTTAVDSANVESVNSNQAQAAIPNP
jgi:hypothetical protein